MTSLPTDCMEHLGLANAVRVARAELRAAVRSEPWPGSCMRVAELLEEPPADIGSMELCKLLRWITRVSSHRARTICLRGDEIAPISETRRIDQLTERQRHSIAEHLRTMATGKRP